MDQAQHKRKASENAIAIYPRIQKSNVICFSFLEPILRFGF